MDLRCLGTVPVGSLHIIGNDPFGYAAFIGGHKQCPVMGGRRQGPQNGTLRCGNFPVSCHSRAAKMLQSSCHRLDCSYGFHPAAANSRDMFLVLIQKSLGSGQ